VEKIYLVAQAPKRKGSSGWSGRQRDGRGWNNRHQNNHGWNSRGWVDRLCKFWPWAAGNQPVGKAGLSLEIQRAVLKEIANKPYTPRQEIKPVPQDQEGVFLSKSFFSCKALSHLRKRKNPRKSGKSDQRCHGPLLLKSECFASKKRSHEIGNAL
jgi:hypothetical protein